MNRMLSAILMMAFCFLSATTFAQTKTSNQTTAKNEASLSGAWHSVDNKEFLIMSDGFFSSVSQDSAGKWTSIHAGTYTIDNANTATLKVTHSSFAYRIGYLHTVEYDLKGENLTFKLYQKMIDPKAGDITARMPKGQQTQYIRAKNK